VIKFRATETINRPIDDIWQFLTNVDRYEEWLPVSHVRVAAGSADAAGGRLEMRMKAMGRDYDMQFDIPRAERPQLLVWRILGGGPMRGEYRAELEAQGAATRVTYAGELQLLGWRRLIEPIAALEVRKGESGELQRMKDILEREKVAAPATA
jgi:carbon monoxide dehydrogenase subunit G